MANIKAAYSGSDMGMSGISSITLSCDCHLTDAQKSAVRNILAGTQVVFSEPFFPDLVLISYSVNGDVLSITASDKLGDSDITFTADGTVFTEYSDRAHTVKSIYHGQAVLDACAAKLGLGSCSVSGLPDLYYSEFVGKTVREILTSISEAAVGVFYARGSLMFAPYTLGQNQSRDLMTVLPKDRTELEVLGKKNIIHAYVTDNTYGETYEYGSGEWYNTVSRSGSYLIGQSVCDNVASKIIPTNYVGWTCKAITTVLPTPNMMFNSDPDHLIRECSIEYGGINVIAEIGSPAPQINKADFQDEKTRALNQKLQLGKTYGNMFIDKNSGLTIRYEALEE